MRAVIAVAAALALAPLPARGDATGEPVPAKARSLADRGRAAHAAGDYSAAIAAFTQAYVIAPSPALLFNLAQAYRLQGNCDDAALMYRRYLATNPGVEQRALAEAHLASVERCLHKIALHIPLETASSRSIEPVAQPSASLAASPGSRRAEIEKDVGIGLAIGGGVSLAVAAYYAIQAHEAENDVNAAFARGGRWMDIADTDARGKSAATNAKLFGAGGAVGLAGGIITYLIGRHDEGPPVTVATTPHGVQLGVRWAY
ncbi:MAG TPA: tetratricopeptide repeat protein [Kofleriaceae bacterium]|jgi:tetratricopeptide (TPR) repeat protein|nr:tetratricopeptide repeat protein [Kofleriaceae bacterium]